MHRSFIWQKAESFDFIIFTFHVKRVTDFFPEHLVAAADADDRYTLFCQLTDFLRIALSLQVQQIFGRILTTRQHDEVRMSDHIPLLYKADIHIRFMIQCIEVGKIRDLRSLHDSDVNISHHVIARHILQGYRVLIIDTQFVQVGDDTQDRDACPFFEEGQRRFKQGDIAPELIDDEPFHEGSLILIEQHQRTDDRSKRTAAVNISDKEDRRVAFLRDTHVNDIIFLQIHFRRTAGPFDDQRIIMRLHIGQGFLHTRPCLLAVLVLVIGSTVVTDRLPQKNDLRAGIARRF